MYWTIKKRLEGLEWVKETASEILASGECYSLRDLAINGNDLAEKGIRGEKIGNLLQISLQNVILGKWENKKDVILCELEKNNW